MYDLIDCHLRECVRQEIRMRVCKNCGRYFAVAGHGGTEYCSRLFDSKGRTCKEIGAVTQWGKSKDAMLCSRSTAGSTSGGLRGSSLAELIRKSSMPGARRPEKRKRSARRERSPLRNFRLGWATHEENRKEKRVAESSLRSFFAYCYSKLEKHMAKNTIIPS